LTVTARDDYHPRFMSAALPETIDAWRAVTARRRYEGALPLSSLPRLAPMLADAAGEVRYAIAFDRDERGSAYVEVVAEAGLPLVCQRTLERFVLPVRVEQRLGLLRREEDEAGLPPGWEPLLVADDAVEPRAVLEDELILAVPLIPTRPGEVPPDGLVWSTGAEPEADQEARPSPFAALGPLRGGSA
jgi:uncharacterized protein